MAADKKLDRAAHKGLPVTAFADAAAWTVWLAAHGAESTGVWLKFAKKGATPRSLEKPEAIRIALAHGWIDGQIDAFDDAYWLTRFTPRGPKSRWSATNCKTVDELIDEGKMTPAGLAAVETAKADGRWEAAYPSQSRAKAPEDFLRALAANPAAQAFYATISSANRYSILYRLHHARGPVAQNAAVARFVAMLARGEVFHPAASKKR